SMNDDYGNSGEDMTDTWVCFGDPSVFVRTLTPQEMVVSHNPSIVIGTSEFTITCDAENLVAALTSNGSIISTAVVSGGMANFSFDPLISADTLTLTITGYNKVPYIAAIPAIATTGPYVVGTSFTIIDLSGNNNGQADYNEDVTIDAALQNLGVSMASDVNATIATTDPFIIITDASEQYGDIQESATLTQSNAFAVSISDNVPDGHIALFTCTITDNAGNTWSSNFSVTINAPVLETAGYIIDDAIGGNGDGYLDPAETATIIIYNTNEGHSNAMNAEGMLSTSSTYVTISDPTYAIGDINTGSQPAAMFEVSVAATAPYGVDVPFTYTVTAGSYSGVFNFNAVVSPAIETFETNDFSMFQWEMSDDADWFTTSVNPYQGTYCSQSGDVANNESSTLQITLDVQFDDDISFAKRISSEAEYDYLQFFIDGQKKDEWSGEAEWTLSTYPVAEGTHTFKWTYSKDGYFSSGSDCAWLDDILLPAYETNVATAINPIQNSNNEVSAYPNPFDQLTVVGYHLSKGAIVSVKIYNEIGKEIKDLVDGEYQTAGSYQLAFDGSKFPSGTYFCKVIIGDESHIHKLILNR
nr:T9SS type A sorting domain-containing protein [Chitinophagales bacterium]